MKKALHIMFFILMLTVVNTAGVASPAHAVAPEGETYIVQADDSLSKIAERVYNDPTAYSAIIEATNAKASEDNTFSAITDPGRLRIGQKLWVPLGLKNTSFPQFTTRWQNVDCAAFDIPSGVIDGYCGFVTVPEFHNEPSGDTIQLAIVVANRIDQVLSKAGGPLPEYTPLFIARGGPGKSAFDLLVAVVRPTSGLQPILWTRDVVFVSQRGTKYSVPYLVCPETLFPGGGAAGEDAADEACKERLETEGVDLDAYDSLENAADMVMVADTLGYDEFNIYGESYGSLLAQFVMRQYPERVRAAILDAVVPPDVDFNANAARTGSHALRELFNACAEDTACNTYYPDLEQVFFSLVDYLDEAPITIISNDGNENGFATEITINGEQFADHIFHLLYSRRVVPHLPRLIYQTAVGDYDWLAPRTLEEDIEPDIARAMTMAVNCSHNDYPEPNIGLEAAYPQLDAHSLDIGPFCALYAVDPLPADTYEPVTNDVPTLVLNGQFDPITPPQYGEYVGSRLPNSFVYTYPGEGHGSLFSNLCVGLMSATFLLDPQKAPDSRCLDDHQVKFAIRPLS